MKYFPHIALLLVAASVSAQEDTTQPAVNTEMPPVPQQETSAEAEADPAQPQTEQTVPVAAEEEAPQAAGVQLPPDASQEDELIAYYGRYLQLMNDRVFDEAESVAKKVVELSLEVKGISSTEFSRALINLAIVQHYTKQYDAAQQNFQSAIEIIEDNEDRLNEQLVNPLKGLGASQLDGGRPDLADLTFRRAVHVTHVNDGPHNMEQIPILESLSETNLRLGDIDEARNIQDLIYTLNERNFASDSMEAVPSLMRRADWQHRAGFIIEERATLRRVVRIIEESSGSEDLQLIEPLILLGKSFFYVVAPTQEGLQRPMSSGEIYFKRALRIATENPAADWQIIAKTSLELADFYMIEGNTSRAQSVYVGVWQFLSENPDRMDYRREQLEEYVTLIQNPLPRFVSLPDENPPPGQVQSMLNGSITIAYEVSEAGRISDMNVVEAHPTNFYGFQRAIQREMRSRIFRPRFVDAAPMASGEQLLVHRFYYTQEDLDEVLPDTEEDSEDT